MMVGIRRERGFTEILCILILFQIAFVGLGVAMGLGFWDILPFLVAY